VTLSERKTFDMFCIKCGFILGTILYILPEVTIRQSIPITPGHKPLAEGHVGVQAAYLSMLTEWARSLSISTAVSTAKPT
jgi:hypothetical protein